MGEKEYWKQQASVDSSKATHWHSGCRAGAPSTKYFIDQTQTGSKSAFLGDDSSGKTERKTAVQIN